MAKHVKLLAVLYIILGALGTLGALVVLLVLGGVAGLVGLSAPGEPEAQIAVPILSMFGGGLFILILIVSLPGLAAGIGLLNFRPWARILAIVLSVLNLLNIPIGTILGIYGLWVLLSSETTTLFAATPKDAMRI